jgi:LCP family protein required for cell wall assembly
VSRPGRAAALSALIPGLGQLLLGARRRGALIALPFVGLIGIAAAAVITDPRGAIDSLLSPGILGGGLVLLLAVATYHLGAVVDAYRLGRRVGGAAEDPTPVVAPAARPRRRISFGSPLLFLALASVITLYGVIEFVGVRAYQAADSIFVDPSSGFEIPEASFAPRPTATQGIAPTGPLTAPPPTSTPVPVPAWAADGRLNLLLIGSDAGPGRWLARMDSVNVLSVDVATGRAAVFSMWRYFANIPLPPESAGSFANGRFPGYLNALYVYAMGHPEQFPGGDAAGFRATAGAVQELIGQPLDGAVVVNLNGFVDLVDAVGGLWIDIPYRVYDPSYPLPDGRSYIEVSFQAGCRKYDGERALEYARTRHQDSDYGRMQRQQRVIMSLARQLDPLALLPRTPELLDIARDNLWTTIQPNEIADLAVLAAKVDTSDVQAYSFFPPGTPQRLNNAGIAHIRDIVGTIFDTPVAASSPTPKPTATPKPCPRT